MRSIAWRRWCSSRTAQDSASRGVLQRVPRRLYKGPGARPREGSNVEDLVHANSFLGFGVRTTHPASYAHLLGRVGDQMIVDPESTLLAVRKAANFLKKLAFRGGRILFISSDPLLTRLTRVIGEQTEMFYLAKRFVPGMLTNWHMGRAHVLKMGDTSRLVGKGRRVKQTDLQKTVAFKGVMGMTRLPDAIVLLDRTDLHAEPEKLNIPVVAVVDTDAPVHSVDYPIPANTRSLRFYHTLSYALVRAVNDGRAVRADLEAHSTAPLAGDGGGARGATSGDGGDARRRARAPLPFRAPDRFGRPAHGPSLPTGL